MAKAVVSKLQHNGLDATLIGTSCADDVGRITEDVAGGHDPRPACIVACGGDGTVQGVAHTLARLRVQMGHTCPALGLAPAGRCNDFARALRVPRDPDGVAAVLMHGKRGDVDLGRVNGRFFCTVATVGVDAEVSRYVDSMRLPLRGTVAYVYGALRVLARYEPRTLKISGDFGAMERPLFLASTANTPSYGGAIRIAPGAEPHDGQLDLCVIESVSKLRAVSLVFAVLAGRHDKRSDVRLIRTRRLRIDCPEPSELWADGERIGCTPATIDVVPAAVSVMLPR